MGSERRVNVLSLCTGYGGLDMAVRAVFGAAPAWVADNDPGAQKILAARFPGVLNLGDITRVAWGAAGPVGILTAGFPCQDVSCAGARRGLRAGTRTGIWAHVAEAIGVLRPSLVFLENVRGLLSAGADSDVEPCPWCLGDSGDESALRALGAVLGDLADLGFDAEWQIVSAADAGAPHRRERVFVLAWPAADADGAPGGERRLAASGEAPGWRSYADAGRRDRAPAADAGHRSFADRARPKGWTAREWPPVGERSRSDADDAPADACRARLGEHPGEPSTEEAGTLAGDVAADHRGVRADRDGRHALADAERGAGDRGPAKPERRQEGRTTARRDSGAPVRWGPYGPAVARWEAVTGRPAPRPTVPGKTGERLSPAFVEWMMGLPEGWVAGVPGLTRNAQLKALGNGVVPQQAELALRMLLARCPLEAAA